jgi:hypothetical protein
MSFEIGDKIEWESQAGGKTTRKRGEIRYVIEDYEYVSSKNYPLHRTMFDSGRRKHKSYLVSVPSTGRGKYKLYWPRVSALRKAKEGEVIDSHSRP